MTCGGGVHTVSYGNRQEWSNRTDKVGHCLRTVSPRVNDMYETMRFEEGEDWTKWSVVNGKLDNACARRTSKYVTQDRFLQLKQESKSVDQFVVELRKQVRDCDFGGCKTTLFCTY